MTAPGTVLWNAAAKARGLETITFGDGSFEPIPPEHVYSWVADQARQEIVRILHRPYGR